MPTVSIPKKITKGEELVVIPRREYERFLAREKKAQALEPDIREALRDIKAGRVFGPFTTVKEGLRFLKRQ
ncbi:MAG: hypothetical protein AAB967_03205 [Patescibacteria group bacterium]